MTGTLREPSGWYLAGCFLCVFNLGFAAGAAALRWHLGAW